MFEKFKFLKTFEFIFCFEPKILFFKFQISSFLILVSDSMDCLSEFFLPWLERYWNVWGIENLEFVVLNQKCLNFQYIKFLGFSDSKEYLSSHFRIRRKCCEAQLRLCLRLPLASVMKYTFKPLFFRSVHNWH